MFGNINREASIVHIDCDAFFASCEQAKDPRLRGHPIVTGKERGIISSASYEARALGIKRGISLREAKAICPELVILPSDYETYSIYSRRLFQIIERFTPTVEEFSIDEAYCDIAGLRRIHRLPYPAIAKLIKSTIQKELDVTVSVGVSLTKTLAKIASRHRKPDGFTEVSSCKLKEFLKNVPLERVCGFGPNTVALLNKCGIYMVSDYVARPVGFSDKLLGKTGVELWYELCGNPIYKVCPGVKDKYLSISKTKTFVPPSCDKSLVKAHLMRNLESAFIKLRRHGLSTSSLTIYLRKSDFEGYYLEGRLDRHSSATLDFTGLCSRLFDALFVENAEYRATGVLLSDILPEGADNRTLFDDPAKIAKIADISKSIDVVNGVYGKYAVHLAAAHQALSNKNPHPRNEPVRRKTELLKGETARKRLRIPRLELV